MGRQTIAQLVILQAMVLGFIAYTGTAGAIEHDRMDPMRLDAHDASQISVRGALLCSMPLTHPKGACALVLVNRENGEALRVAGSDTAIRLYQNGQTRVVATGILYGDVLEVSEIHME